ncbi:MAG: hypothetical protein HYX80_01835 [Chloroflexi bacterium]|nr:hypothetical protein [Chloroflexota bacterium]
MMDFEGAIAELKNKDNAETFNRSVHSLQAIVDNLLAHGSHGLAALKTLLDAIEGDLNSSAYGLSVLRALVYEVETRLDDGTAGLPALKTLIDSLAGELTDGTYGLAALKALTDAIQAKLDDGTSGLEALKSLLDSIESKLDRLSGEAPASGTVTANWNSGTATSGETGADVATIGLNGAKKKLHSLLLSVHSFTPGGRVTVRLYMRVKGVERKVYQEDFNKGTDPDGLWIVNGTVGIHDSVRVELQSNRSADNGMALDYDFMLEEM